MEEEPRPMTELEEIQMKINEQTDNSLESTRRMVNLCEESKDAGIRTLVMLDEQGEQLERIDTGMDTINQDMKEAEKNLSDLGKCCGLFTCPWQKGKNFDKDPNFAGAFKGNQDGSAGGMGARVIDDRNGLGPSGGYVTKLTNDAREDEMEENVGQVTTMIGNLRNMAMDMGQEVNNQNRLLDGISTKAVSNEARISEANNRAAKLL